MIRGKNPRTGNWYIGQFSTLTPTGRTVVNLKELVASKKVQATLDKLAAKGDTVVISPTPDTVAATTDDK